jgi:hypothetical protein
VRNRTPARQNELTTEAPLIGWDVFAVPVTALLPFSTY